MAAVDLTIEPGFLYFRRARILRPTSSFPGTRSWCTAHLQVRLDGLERNLLELPHDGVATGFDLILGHRFTWQDWGMAGAEAASSGRNYASLRGYFLAAGAVPGIESDRHRSDRRSPRRHRPQPGQVFGTEDRRRAESPGRGIRNHLRPGPARSHRGGVLSPALSVGDRGVPLGAGVFRLYRHQRHCGTA